MDFLQYVDMDTFLHRLAPVTKFLFFVAMAVVTSFVKNGPPLVLLMGFFLIIWITSHIGKYMFVLFVKLRVLLIFICLLWLVLGLFQVNSANPLFGTQFDILGRNVNLSFEWYDIYKGLVFSTRVYLMVASFFTIIVTTNFSEIILGLRKLKLPYSISFGIGLIFQIIPIIIKEFYAIMEAQSSRGLEVEKCSAKDKMKNYLTLSLPLLFRVLGKGHSISLAMYYYNLDFKVKRTSYKTIKAGFKDMAFLVATVLVIAGSIVINSVFFYPV